MGIDCHVDNHDGIVQAAEEKKHRGPTLMAKVHQHKPEERHVIVLNANGLPIGPSDDVVVEFGNFLGTIAKDPQLAPLNIIDWKYMQTKEDIWSYVKTQKDPNKEPPPESTVYKESRKRDSTRVYKTDGCKAMENIEKLDKLQLEIESGEKNSNVEPLCEVIGKKYREQGFLQGRGATVAKSKVNEKKGGYILDQVFFQNMKAEWTTEITTHLASKILSQLQAANPLINLVILDFTSTPTNSNQVIEDQNLQNVVGTHPTPQMSGDEEG